MIDGLEYNIGVALVCLAVAAGFFLTGVGLMLLLGKLWRL